MSFYDVTLDELARMLWVSAIVPALQPSLLPLVDFLVNVFGWRLPQETCVSCDKKVLPDNPRHPALKDPAHKDRPTRQALRATERVGDLVRCSSGRSLFMAWQCCDRACRTTFFVSGSVRLSCCAFVKDQCRFTTWPSSTKWLIAHITIN